MTKDDGLRRALEALAHEYEGDQVSRRLRAILAEHPPGDSTAPAAKGMYDPSPISNWCEECERHDIPLDEQWDGGHGPDNQWCGPVLLSPPRDGQEETCATPPASAGTEECMVCGSQIPAGTLEARGREVYRRALDSGALANLGLIPPANAGLREVAARYRAFLEHNGWIRDGDAKAIFDLHDAALAASPAKPEAVKLWRCETCDHSGPEDWAWAHYEATSHKHSRFAPEGAPRDEPARPTEFAIPDTVAERVDKVMREARLKVREYLAKESANLKPIYRAGAAKPAARRYVCRKCGQVWDHAPSGAHYVNGTNPNASMVPCTGLIDPMPGAQAEAGESVLCPICTTPTEIWRVCPGCGEEIAPSVSLPEDYLPEDGNPRINRMLKQGTRPAPVEGLREAVEKFKATRGVHEGPHYQPTAENPDGIVHTCAQCWEAYSKAETDLDAALSAKEPKPKKMVTVEKWEIKS